MNRVAIRFEAGLKLLDNLFIKAANCTDPKEREILCSFIIIKLHDQWNFRSRQIVLENYGKSETNMIEFLRSNWSRKRMGAGWEPDWHIPANAIRAASLLGVARLADIQNALGSVTKIDEVRWTRNAIVHNIPTSFQKYRTIVRNNYGQVGIAPHDILFLRNSASGKTIYEDWCNELTQAISAI